MNTNGGLTLYVELHVPAEIQKFTSQLLKCFLWEDNIKVDIKNNKMWWRELDSFGVYCEHDNKSYTSVKDE
jgi:hypothetical protein